MRRRRAPRGVPVPQEANMCAPIQPTQPTRSRMCELTVLARKIAGEVDKAGLKYDEFCLFGDIVQRMLHLKEK